MTSIDQITALIAKAQQLAEQAKNDPELANRLLANPAETVAEASGHQIPAGVLVTAARNDEGAIELDAKPTPDFDGELDDTLLDAVSGGRAGMTTMFDFGGFKSLKKK
jgi:hypothetical protein